MDNNCLLCGNSESILVMKKFADGLDAEPIALQKCFTCKLVYLASWEGDYHSEDYLYYSARIDIKKSDLYCPITESRYFKLK